MSRTIEKIKANLAAAELNLAGLVNAGADYHRRARQDVEQLNYELRLALTDYIPLDRLEAICAAEKGGRCVVLPCKVGGAVYFVADGAVKETRLLAIKANVSDPAYSGNPSIIYEGYFQIGMHVMCWSIGNRLYLTRAEAEAALKGDAPNE